MDARHKFPRLYAQARLNECVVADTEALSALDLLDAQQETIDQRTAERDDAVEQLARWAKTYDDLIEANAALTADLASRTDYAASRILAERADAAVGIEKLRAVNDRLIEALRELHAYVSYATKPPPNLDVIRSMLAALLAGAPVQDTERPHVIVRCIRCERDVPYAEMTEQCPSAPDFGPHEGIAPPERRRSGWSLHNRGCPAAEPFMVGHEVCDAACTCRAVQDTERCSTCQDTGTVHVRRGDDDWDQLDCPACRAVQEITPAEPQHHHVFDSDWHSSGDGLIYQHCMFKGCTEKYWRQEQ